MSGYPLSCKIISPTDFYAACCACDAGGFRAWLPELTTELVGQHQSTDLAVSDSTIGKIARSQYKSLTVKQKRDVRTCLQSRHNRDVRDGKHSCVN